MFILVGFWYLVFYMMCLQFQGFLCIFVFCCYHLEFRPLGWWVLSNNIQASSNLSHLFLFDSWPTTLILKSNLFSVCSSSLKWSATGFSFLVFIILSWSHNQEDDVVDLEIDDWLTMDSWGNTPAIEEMMPIEFENLWCRIPWTLHPKMSPKKKIVTMNFITHF